MSNFIINKNFGFGADGPVSNDGTSGSSAIVTMQQLAVGTTQQEPGMANQQNLLATLGNQKSGMLGITTTGGASAIARYFSTPTPDQLKGVQALLVAPAISAMLPAFNCVTPSSAWTGSTVAPNLSLQTGLTGWLPFGSSPYTNFSNVVPNFPSPLGIASFSYFVDNVQLSMASSASTVNGFGFTWPNPTGSPPIQFLWQPAAATSGPYFTNGAGSLVNPVANAVLSGASLAVATQVVDCIQSSFVAQSCFTGAGIAIALSTPANVQAGSGNPWNIQYLNSLGSGYQLYYTVVIRFQAYIFN
jgi:hypothetical protein